MSPHRGQEGEAAMMHANEDHDVWYRSCSIICHARLPLSARAPLVTLAFFSLRAELGRMDDVMALVHSAYHLSNYRQLYADDRCRVVCRCCPSSTKALHYCHPTRLGDRPVAPRRARTLQRGSRPTERKPPLPCTTYHSPNFLPRRLRQRADSHRERGSSRRDRRRRQHPSTSFEAQCE